MQIEVKTIKKILLKEYEELFKATNSIVRRNTYSDVCHEMLHHGYDVGRKCIENAETYDELQGALDFCGYRMSLQEWLNGY